MQIDGILNPTLHSGCDAVQHPWSSPKFELHPSKRDGGGRKHPDLFQVQSHIRSEECHCSTPAPTGSTRFPLMRDEMKEWFIDKARSRSRTHLCGTMQPKRKKESFPLGSLAPRPHFRLYSSRNPQSNVFIAPSNPRSAASHLPKPSFGLFGLFGLLGLLGLLGLRLEQCGQVSIVFPSAKASKSRGIVLFLRYGFIV